MRFGISAECVDEQLEVESNTKLETGEKTSTSRAVPLELRIVTLRPDIWPKEAWQQ
jgi:hypothetical protein